MAKVFASEFTQGELQSNLSEATETQGGKRGFAGGPGHLSHRCSLGGWEVTAIGKQRLEHTAITWFLRDTPFRTYLTPSYSLPFPLTFPVSSRSSSFSPK